MAGPNIDFWQTHFESGKLPWDRGEANSLLLDWIQPTSGRAVWHPQTDANAPPVVVPGCGAAHEVIALARAGFKVLGLDYTPGAVELARQSIRDAGLQHLASIEQADVMTWQPATPLDTVYDQTCLCALHPDQWMDYGAQLARWLRPAGQLRLLAMQVPRPGSAEGLIEGPPYHCDINAVRAVFPATRWEWPKPPYPLVPHKQTQHEIALILTRRSD